MGIQETSDLDSARKWAPIRDRVYLGADLLLALSLLSSGIKFTQGLAGVLDLGVYDEAVYLHRGLTLLSAPLHGGSASPLYSIWYFFLSLFERDPARIYFLNCRLLTILLPVAAYALLRALRRPIWVSAIAAWLLLLARVNLLTGPKSPHLALLLLFATLLVVARAPSLFSAAVISSLGALLVAYARPEYFVAYVTCIGVLLAIAASPGTLGFRTREQRHRVLGLVVCAVLSVSVMAVLGVPFGGGRSIIAFGQHFSKHWVAWTGSQVNPWSDWRHIVTENFGPVHSVAAAMVANPELFARHVAANALAAPREAISLALPQILVGDTLTTTMAALLALCLCLTGRRQVRANVTELRHPLLFSGVFLLPGLTSALVIYPRSHYLVVPIFLGSIWLLLLFGKRRPDMPPRNSWTSAILLGLVLLTFTPHFAHRFKGDRPNFLTTRWIASLHLQSPVNILETGRYSLYLGPEFHRVDPSSKQSGFARFAREQAIDLVVVSRDLREDGLFRRDREWLDFLRHPRRNGYTKMKVPHTGRTILVRSELLASSSSR